MIRRDILALVMLPPPIHGASSINLKMIEALKQSSESLTVFNTVPSGFGWLFDGFLWKLLKAILICFIFLKVCFRFFHPPKCIYISISGGLGLFFDCVLALAVRLLGRPVFVHHHSFSYINSDSIFFRLFCYLLKPLEVTHVVLCREMGDLLCERYSKLVSPAFIYVLSNSSFFSPAFFDCSNPIAHRKIRIGFISNITKEKGIYDVFSLAHRCHLAGYPVEFVVAGPCADRSILSDLNRTSELYGFFKYIGPVYGFLKESFFGSIDVLVFPTNYDNEAEPLVIYEAAERGVPTIANARGCIASMVSQCGGWVVKNESVFVDDSLKIISELLSNDSIYESQKTALSGCASLMGVSRGALDTLLIKIGRGSGSTT